MKNKMEIVRNTTYLSKEIERDFNNVHLYGNLSYATLCKLCFTDMILCNSITEVDVSVFDNMKWIPDEDDEEGEIYPEIYQYYIVNPDNYFLEKYKDAFLMSYSEVLDCYILCVDHFGISWSYLPTNVKIVEKKEE